MKYFLCLVIGVLIGIIFTRTRTATYVIRVPEKGRTSWFIRNDTVIHLQDRDTLFVTKI